MFNQIFKPQHKYPKSISMNINNSQKSSMVDIKNLNSTTDDLLNEINNLLELSKVETKINSQNHLTTLGDCGCR